MSRCWKWPGGSLLLVSQQVFSPERGDTDTDHVQYFLRHTEYFSVDLMTGSTIVGCVSDLPEPL